MRHLLSALLLSSIFFCGCTAVISEQSRKLVDTDATFKSVKETPQNYIGKHTLVGGRIAGVRNGSEGAQLEIVQFDLDNRGYPEDSFLSHGRFLATSSSYLDPLVFRAGMLMTLVGEIKGKKTLRLDDMDYTYPVIEIREWHLWKGSEADRGCIYPLAPPQYNPYNYGFGYEPFLPRPSKPITAPR